MNLEEIRAFCNSLKGVTEDIKWDDHLCFCIGEKMFVVTSLAGKDTMSFKVTNEQFDEMIETNHFISAPYMGRYKWVFMEDFKSISEDQLKFYMNQSYELIKSKLPKRLQKSIDETF